MKVKMKSNGLLNKTLECNLILRYYSNSVLIQTRAAQFGNPLSVEVEMTYGFFLTEVLAMLFF